MTTSKGIYTCVQDAVNLLTEILCKTTSLHDNLDPLISSINSLSMVGITWLVHALLVILIGILLIAISLNSGNNSNCYTKLHVKLL